MSYGLEQHRTIIENTAVLVEQVRHLQQELADSQAENQRLRDLCDRQSKRLELYAARERGEMAQRAA